MVFEKGASTSSSRISFPTQHIKRMVERGEEEEEEKCSFSIFCKVKLKRNTFFSKISFLFHFSLRKFQKDHKLKHMAELQQSVVTDQDTRHQIQTQILTWEENLERLHCEQFRLRCYMASLQSGELPNPKVCTIFTFTRSFFFHPY